MKAIEQSIEALMKQLESGQITNLDAQILNHAKSVGAFNKEELIERLGRPHQSVTSSISFLQDVGLIEPVTKVLVRGYNQTRYLYVADEDRRTRVARRRKTDKFMGIMKRLKVEFPEYMVNIQYRLPL
jgi:predicted transcriptional regulator